MGTAHAGSPGLGASSTVTSWCVMHPSPLACSGPHQCGRGGPKRTRCRSGICRPPAPTSAGRDGRQPLPMPLTPGVGCAIVCRSANKPTLGAVETVDPPRSGASSVGEIQACSSHRPNRNDQGEVRRSPWLLAGYAGMDRRLSTTAGPVSVLARRLRHVMDRRLSTTAGNRFSVLIPRARHPKHDLLAYAHNRPALAFPRDRPPICGVRAAHAIQAPG